MHPLFWIGVAAIGLKELTDAATRVAEKEIYTELEEEIEAIRREKERVQRERAELEAMWEQLANGEEPSTEQKRNSKPARKSLLKRFLEWGSIEWP